MSWPGSQVGEVKGTPPPRTFDLIDSVHSFAEKVVESVFFHHQFRRLVGDHGVGTDMMIDLFEEAPLKESQLEMRVGLVPFLAYINGYDL
jgi:hypothetical protein